MLIGCVVPIPLSGNTTPLPLGAPCLISNPVDQLEMTSLLWLQVWVFERRLSSQSLSQVDCSNDQWRGSLSHLGPECQRSTNLKFPEATFPHYGEGLPTHPWKNEAENRDCSEKTSKPVLMESRFIPWTS